ncbi:SDR family NAD(P)-dependent oxidoreductase [Planococcus shixiaomingii]|uniref:SDR family NAD(P)-dependent oxidoreductase n=1 Tax=Planococcus shixiaomingii TaxID=3058393 RepID=UPI00262A865F|nr:SDR family oxidoreductase [Planococcus sp. N022]WKA54595.1 SDR family oxidoreductase [Planococcus sp. N022]
MDLAGKVAVVTGAASGIGLATAKALAEKGAKVVVADINEEGGEAAAKELQDNGKESAFVKFDAAQEDSVANLVARTVNQFGRIDVMVNNAGIRSLSETHMLSFEDYRKVIAVNQDGVFFGSKHAIREMLKTGGGVIINTASILGSVGEASAFAVSASKGAVNLMTKSLALQYADKNIRVNAVGPGFIETGMTNRSTMDPELYAKAVAKHPIGRLGQPEEVAHAIVFLCENDFVTGTTLMVDGGYTAQ